MLQYPGHEARARTTQGTRGVEEHRYVVLVQAHVQVVAVAGPIQVRFGSHRGLESHPVGDAPDRLEHHYALVRSGQRLVLPYGELEVAMPDLGVALLRTNTHLLQGLGQLSDELSRRGEREAPSVRRSVQGAVGTPDVELGLVGGKRPVAPLR